MKFPRFPRTTPRVRSAKFIPIVIVSLFAIFNFTNRFQPGNGAGS